MNKHASIASYLQEGRLADVLALIQVLAYDRNTARSEEGLMSELQRKPLSTESWLELGRQHSEFFRVRSEANKTPRVALIARYVKPYEELPNGEEKRLPLEADITNKLMEFAMQLHDRQLGRSERWKTWIPVVVATIAAVAAIGAAVVGAQKAASTTPISSQQGKP